MEKWKDIEGHPNYQVSDQGRVMNKKTGRIMKQFERSNGYMQTQMDKKTELVHRLVASSFCGGDHKDLEVNHIDCNKHNNSASNLEWTSRSENIIHSFEHGIRKSNLDSNCRRKGNEVVLGRFGKRVLVLESGAIYPSLKECAREMGTYPAKIKDCCLNALKTHCGFHFKFID